MNASIAAPVVSTSSAWANLSEPLTDWTLYHLVNRSDTYGIYTPDAKRALVYPPTAPKGKAVPLTRQIIADHYDSTSGAPRIGLYTTDPVTQLGRWLLLDLDAHKESRLDIFDYALLVGRRMWAHGVFPIIEHSNGNGGYKVWAVFAEPQSVRLLRNYGHWLTRDAAEHGVTEVEVFPKQNEVRADGFGNYVRLFGKHHKRDWHSEFWDLRLCDWFRGADAPGYLLERATVDNKTVGIPEEVRNYIPAKKVPNLPEGGTRLGDDWLHAFTGDLRTLKLDALFDSRGMLEGEQGGGIFDVMCPWHGEHTTGHDTAHIWTETDSGFPSFYCHHAHCEGRGLKEVCEFFGVDVVNAHCESEYQPRAISRARDLEDQLVEKLAADTYELTPIRENAGGTAVEVVEGKPTKPKPPKEPGKDKPDGFHYQRLAERFIRESGRRVVFHQGNHYVYRGDRYEPLKDTEFNYEVRSWLVSTRVPHNNTVVGNVVPFVNTFARVSAVKQLPFYKGEGTFPHPANVIGYRNGLLDTGRYLAGHRTLIPHTPEWVSTVCLPFEFDPAATCPTWERFLSEVFEGDDERAALLQEYFGYCLTQNTSMHKVLVMCGVRRSGKGTIQRVLQQLVGEQNSAAFDLWKFAERFGMSALANKLVAFVGEVNLTGHEKKTLIYQKLNSVVGGDVQDIEQKGKDSYSAYLPTRFVIACNEMPTFPDSSGALAARLLILNFEVSFEGREDTGLGGKLTTELPGINNWALAGLTRLKAQGRFTVPASMQEAKEEFERESNTKLAFLRECCRINPALNPGNLTGVRIEQGDLSVDIAHLVERWEKWCVEKGLNPGNSRWFCRDLRTLLPKLKEKRRSEDKRSRYYANISLL